MTGIRTNHIDRSYTLRCVRAHLATNATTNNAPMTKWERFMAWYNKPFTLFR